VPREPRDALTRLKVLLPTGDGSLRIETQAGAKPSISIFTHLYLDVRQPFPKVIFLLSSKPTDRSRWSTAASIA